MSLVISILHSHAACPDKCHHATSIRRAGFIKLVGADMMVTHDILGDSLAKGLVHQRGRDASRRADQKIKGFQAEVLVRKESRGARYRQMIAQLKGVAGNGMLKTVEVGDGKHKIWHSYLVEVDAEGELMLSHFWVPFKNPTDFDYENAPFTCHPHGHQRLLQIHGKIEPVLIYGIWVAHFRAFEEGFASNNGWRDCDDASILTFSETEVMVWRPSRRRESSWEAITAVSVDALYGPKLKAFHRLKSGYRDAKVCGVIPEELERYVSRNLRERIGAHVESHRVAISSGEGNSLILAA